MRAGRQVATVLLALGLGGTATACGALQEASDTANAVNDTVSKTQLCLEAVQIMGFNPDVSDPQKAVDEAHAKAAQLDELAAKAGDTTLKDAFTDASAKLHEVSVSDLDPANATTWLQEKADRLTALNTACGG
ncbi:bacteriophage spanin2 family protein [Umezawaea beigongshangensis]|uniref:bacteriophage spanin2 family protein n=1 Tax=Umezawaea beigongshangensis TaxID=2780383 RepID=UPI0018F1CC87|nr:bacteriophage spanin2 family protein [Umezawaea beigongshangensis]